MIRSKVLVCAGAAASLLLAGGIAVAAVPGFAQEVRDGVA